MKVCWLLAALCLVGCSPEPERGTAVSPGSATDGGRRQRDAAVADAAKRARPDAAPEVEENDDAAVPGGDPPPDIVTIDQCGSDNPAKLSSADVARLRSTTPASELAWLYPFADTVFPRGLRAPLLMWSGGSDAPRAVFVSLQSKHFAYQGCLQASTSGRVALPADVWQRASEQGFGKSDPFALELRELDASGVVHGPVTTRFVIAPGSLKGSIFYNSYSSRLALAQGAPGGAVLRIRAGQDAEVFAGQRGCVGCHAVSANGARLVASNLASTENSEGVYELTPSTPNNPPSKRRGTDFVALTPDGKLYATGNSGYDANVLAGLYATDSGELITDSQLPSTAMHPNFSPAGKLLTFLDTTSATTADQTTLTNSLVTMDFDPSARRLSNYRKVLDVTVQQGDWPSFLPDNGALLYARAAGGQLWLLDLTSHEEVPLARAMRFASEQEALQRAADPNAVPDPERDAYYPTVAPVAVGGYFWVFFDTFRAFGNVVNRVGSTMTPVPVDPPAPPGGGLPDWLTGILGGAAPPPPVDPTLQPIDQPVAASRQLWGAAIEVSADGRYLTDPSQPPFYLDGQELGTNNHRAFAALDPCSARGSSCESGIDCCDGFCEQGSCVVPPNRCAKTEEACSQQSDCCNSADRCINRFCSVVVIPLL